MIIKRIHKCKKATLPRRGPWVSRRSGEQPAAMGLGVPGLGDRLLPNPRDPGAARSEPGLQAACYKETEAESQLEGHGE